MSIGPQSCPGCIYSGHSHLEGCPNGIYRRFVPAASAPAEQVNAPPRPLDLKAIYNSCAPDGQHDVAGVKAWYVRELIERVASLEARVRETQRLAFVEGAKWWEWHEENATMWPSDQQLAYERALEKYPEPTTSARPEPVGDEPTSG